MTGNAAAWVFPPRRGAQVSCAQGGHMRSPGTPMGSRCEELSGFAPKGRSFFGSWPSQ